MKIFVDSMDCCHQNLFVSISSEEFKFLTLVTDVNANGITFSDNFVAINEVGKSDCGVFLQKLRFGLVEPLISGGTVVEFLSVLDTAVLQELSDSF